MLDSFDEPTLRALVNLRGNKDFQHVLLQLGYQASSLAMKARKAPETRQINQYHGASLALEELCEKVAGATELLQKQLEQKEKRK